MEGKAEIITINCKLGCNGVNDSCISEVKRVVESGNVAYMFYTEHIKQEAETLGYRTRVLAQNGIPVGLYVMNHSLDVRLTPEDDKLNIRVKGINKGL